LDIGKHLHGGSIHTISIQDIDDAGLKDGIQVDVVDLILGLKMKNCGLSMWCLTEK